ncbi:MAG: FHA domain-containing protein [Pyrinomonadaceae bacterium]
MKKVILKIEDQIESKIVELEHELTIGRTDASDLILNDTGLSRKNTTIFRDGDEVFAVDEHSLNGTHLNGRRLEGPPAALHDGDEIRIGIETVITIAFETDNTLTRPHYADDVPVPTSPVDKTQDRLPDGQQEDRDSGPPILLIAAAALTIVIILGGLLAYVIISRYEPSTNEKNGSVGPSKNPTARIPVRVIDPLGGEDEDDINDLIASWETAETEIDASTVADISVSIAEAPSADVELNVTASFFADKQRKALEPRQRESGIKPGGLSVPRELFGDGVIKQKRKLSEMKATGYSQPLDFADLAEKRLSRELIEMPMAKDSYYLDVGGSASDGPFTTFSFFAEEQEISPGTPKYKTLLTLSENFGGQRYDLGNSTHRKQMRIRLLRMFNQQARPILLELAGAYLQKFGRPLRVTSLTRSMDYQILLNKGNTNSFKVRDANALPPHTSGCAFDLARKHMTADEQNFVMQKLAEMERAKKLDALIEYGANACFHVFIYNDGRPPKM